MAHWVKHLPYKSVGDRIQILLTPPLQRWRKEVLWTRGLAGLAKSVSWVQVRSSASVYKDWHLTLPLTPTLTCEPSHIRLYAGAWLHMLKKNRPITGHGGKTSKAGSTWIWSQCGRPFFKTSKNKGWGRWFGRKCECPSLNTRAHTGPIACLCKPSFSSRVVGRRRQDNLLRVCQLDIQSSK